MNAKLTLNDILKIIVKHIWIVIVGLVVGAGGAVVLGSHEGEVHNAMAQVVVSPKARFDISSTTISDLVKSKKVLGYAVTQYNRGRSTKDKVEYSELYETLKVQINGNSRMVTITTEADSKKDAKQLVSYIVHRTKTVSDADLPAWKSAIVTEATIVDKEAEGFGTKKTLALGGGVGLFLGIALTFVLEAMKVRTKKSAAK